MRHPEERSLVEDYGQQYRDSSAAIMLSIEEAVFGSDYGSSGYTSVEQAKQLIEVLPLGPDKRVLDLGAGCGWPGLFLALETESSLVATDLPLNGLIRAADRAGTEGISERVLAVVSSARALPFCDASFDTIVHSDFLC